MVENTSPYNCITSEYKLKKQRDKEELFLYDPSKASSANAYSWITKRNITLELTKKYSYSHARVLIVGCGWGRELIAFPTAIGIDICLPFLKVVRKYMDNDIILADAHYLPFKNSFDLIIMSEVIEHLKSPPKAIVEVKSILGDQGKLIISTPNKAITMKKINPDHISEYTLNELARLLKGIGFRILERRGSTIPYVPSSLKWSRLFDNIFFLFIVWKILNRLIPLKWDIIIVAEK